MNHKGYFITFEGVDGSGKSSVALRIKEELEKLNFKILHTREPGGIEIAESIREIILNPKNVAMDQRTEALLYAASRRQHLVQKVIPALLENKIVLCERFLDSSLAYQGYARGIGIEEVLKINDFAINDIMPDFTIFLDVDEKVGLDRISNRVNKDRLDLESINFHSKVKKGYDIVNEMFKDRIVKVDASKPLNDVVDEILAIIVKKIYD